MTYKTTRALRFALTLALAILPASAAFAGTAHYFVIVESRSTGELAVVSHQLVEMTAMPERTSLRARKSAHESRLQARIADKLTGDARFDTMVTGSPWLRGEFHGADTIDGHFFPLEERHYVVRVPVESSALLELQGLDGDAAATSLVAQAPRLVRISMARMLRSGFASWYFLIRASRDRSEEVV